MRYRAAPREVAARAGLRLRRRWRRPKVRPRRGRTTPPRGHEPTVTGPRRHSTWSGTTNVAVPRGPAGVQVTRASGPKGSGARLGRRSHWRLGSAEGRVQVGSYLGHDLLGAADPGLPAAFAAGVALAALGSGRGPDGDLVPGDLLVDGDGHGSPPIGRVWPNLSTWEAGHQLARWGPGMRSVAVALVTPRYALVAIAALASVPRPGHGGPKADERRKVESPPLSNREQQNTTHFC